MRHAVLLAAIPLLLSLPACRRPAGPAETYRAFAAAVRSGDEETAWRLLAERSKAAFERAGRAAAEAAPAGVVPRSGAELLLGNAALRSPKVKSALVVRESGEAAVVAVELDDGGRGEVELVRERGGWRVVVPPAAVAPERGGQGG